MGIAPFTPSDGVRLKSTHCSLWGAQWCSVPSLRRSRLRFFASTGALEKLNAHDISDCSGCKLAKFSALPFSNSDPSSNASFDLVHSNVWGPSPVSTKGGSRYYISFIKDFTQYTWVYLMKRRYCIGIESLKLELAHRFAMKDLGLLSYFLGIEVTSSPKGYLLSQSKYIDDLLNRARIIDKMVEDIPIDAKAKYTLTDGDPLPYPSTQFQTLLLPSMSALDLRVYCDSNCAGDVVSRKPITGFCILLGDSLLSWKSKKQDVLSKSSTKAEYRAKAVTTSEIVWLRWLLADIGICIRHSTLSHCDNRRAIQIARNSVFHECTNHIEIDSHFTRHHLLAETISLPFVPSALQIVYVFTKPHYGPHFHFLTAKLSLFLAAT
ncbi:uncharacterized mitochondrial protein-like protein [Tanacetum coccineum]